MPFQIIVCMNLVLDDEFVFPNKFVFRFHEESFSPNRCHKYGASFLHSCASNAHKSHMGSILVLGFVYGINECSSEVTFFFIFYFFGVSTGASKVEGEHGASHPSLRRSTAAEEVF